ncbi:MAG TPA: serine/threonine-protein kinase, partial [Myxococcaceae bacterium]|nr:serine/threonine-protein kinase [Myxococcaceae bacterium]
MDSGAPGDQGCLSDELLVRLSEGRLADEELRRALLHATGCGACHDDIASVMNEWWEPPPVIDELEIASEIGRGGMGIVYLARDTALQRQVAIKFIAEPHPDPRLRRSFEDEARLLASLQHPNIVTVFRAGQVEDHPYLVSEYVVGRSLAKLPAPLPWPRVLALGTGLARGLAAAHRQGVLHRDVKPSNAIETAGGDVKLLDFGLAQRVGAGGPDGASRERAIAGTPRYMAPEVREGAPATPLSDLYSLGLVLRELCTGRSPREEAGAPAAVVDPDLLAIIERCTRPDPRERFASADLLVEALERLSARVPAALSANPYRGLEPYEAEHQALFFGRGADVQRVLERLDRQHVVLVAADSGLGKSSLCRAGVLPRVATGAIAGGRPLAVRLLAPGRRPLRALAAAFATALPPAEAELLSGPAADPRQTGQCVRAACERLGGALVFVDQLEELITLAGPGEAAAFTRVLGELVSPPGPARLLLAVRGDFLARVASLPGLGDEAERAVYFLRPMTPQGLREAIAGPARAGGVAFESDALVQDLVDFAARGSGELPLLSFALAALWERRDVPGARITRAALDEVGGVAGLLSRHADGVVAQLTPVQQRAARRMLISLVTAEDTRGERTEEDLEVASEDARVALRALVDGRLLQARSAAGRVSYQIAHDALIQRWPRLRQWLDDDIGHRAVRQRLEAASAEWDRLHRPRGLLWQGEQLQETRPLDPGVLGTLERAFLSESRRRTRLQRRLRWLAAALAVLVPPALYGGFRLQSYLADARWVDARLQAARASSA